MLGPEDLGKGLSPVVASYIAALQSAAERFEDPAERRIADRVVSMATEMLASQLQAAAAPTSPN
ncbi:hypothetical protein N8D56_19755 [Devosia sp. A8/3-2]|nr:hypothetical protein N8D56_19755 [Devosia sp. A8/3-2]